MKRRLINRAILLGLALVSMFVFALACAGSAEPTATPIPPAAPAAPAAPTAVPQPTAAPAPGQPTAVPATPTPTRVLPTATAVASTGPKYGGTIRFVYALDVDTLDPVYNSLPGTYYQFYAMYNSPFRLTPSGVLQPDLAETWSFSPDGKTVTMKFRQGVKFHDGTDFNAQVFKWNYDRMVDPANATLRRAELTPYVQDVKVVDQNTATIEMKQPFRPLLFQMAGERMGWVVSPTAVQKFGGGLNGDYGRKPVGTGPFIFKEWLPRDRITVTKNPNYWEKGKPYLDSIVFQGAADANLMVAMVRTGESDIMGAFGVRAQDVPLFQKQSNIVVVPNPAASTAILQFNTTIKPFDNLALRQAISYGIDRKKFVDVVLAGQGVPAATFVSGGFAYNPDLKPIDYDPVKAKQKLAEAGYPNGVTVSMGCTAAGVYSDQCAFTQAMLREIGINVSIQIIPDATYFAMTEAGYFGRPGFGTSRWAYRVDPDTVITALWHKGGFKNLGTYNNPELSTLIEQAAAEYDTTKAKVLYNQIQTLAMTAANVPTLAWLTLYDPMSTAVKGFEVRPTVFEHLEFLWLDR